MTDIPLGLYIYPVLQSADILLYKYEFFIIIYFIYYNIINYFSCDILLEESTLEIIS